MFVCVRVLDGIISGGEVYFDPAYELNQRISTLKTIPGAGAGVSKCGCVFVILY